MWFCQNVLEKMINFPVLGFKAQEAFILKKSILFGHFKTRNLKKTYCVLTE